MDAQYICPLCDEAFYDKDCFVSHISKHNGTQRGIPVDVTAQIVNRYIRKYTDVIRKTFEKADKENRPLTEDERWYMDIELCKRADVERILGELAAARSNPNNEDESLRADLPVMRLGMDIGKEIARELYNKRDNNCVGAQGERKCKQ